MQMPSSIPLLQSATVAITERCGQLSDDACQLTVPGAFRPLTRIDVAGILGVSVRTIENWRKQGRMPMSVDIGGRAYWHPAAFYAWLDTTLKAPTGAVVDRPAKQLDATMRAKPRNPQSVQGAARAVLSQEKRLAAMAGDG